MTFQIVEVNSCKRSLEAEIPAGELDQEVDKLAREYSQKAKIPGFRQGKVPLSIVKQRFGNDLLQEATQHLIERSWKEALAEHNLQPLAQPVVEKVDNKPGNPLKFTLAFEVFPALEIKDYKGIPVNMPSSEVSEDDVNRALESMREQHAQFVPVDNGEAGDGHYLSLAISGQFEDGSKPLKEDDVVVVLGQSQNDGGFSENLRGARTGENRSFVINYPKDFPRERFAGKIVSYTVTVKDIKEKQLTELNDEFAKDLGADSLEKLKSQVKDELVTQATQSAEKKARESALDSIVQRHSLDVPECMVQDELEGYARRIAHNLAQQGVDIGQTSIDWKKIIEKERPQAEQNVRRSMVLHAIALQENIEVTEEEFESELQSLAESVNKTTAALRAQFEKDDRFQSFKEHLRQNKALDFIYRNANISVG